MRIGILGGGQLGKMLAMAGQPLGFECTVLDPSPDPCAASVARHLHGEYDDFAKLYELVQSSDVVTYEFENVPVESARWLAERLPVYPPPQALDAANDRLIEKQFFNTHGVPTAGFRPIDSEADLRSAVADLGLPAVLKTRRFGYDGKGQFVLRTHDDIAMAWKALAGRPLILEAFVPFERELSLIAVRSATGETAFYPLIENTHRDGILHTSLAPAPGCGEELTERSCEHAAVILNALKYVGVLTIEWFQEGSRLIANEMAPRVHNSGHWTIEGSSTSQFENHLRAICGLPLGATTVHGAAGLLNLVGVRPDWATLLAVLHAHLHWYGKVPKPKRKVGHVSVHCQSADERDEQLQRCEEHVAHLTK